jgi:hypothetical protein
MGGFLKNVLSKMLSHPAWTGVGTIIALIALFVSLYQGSSSTYSTKSIALFVKDLRVTPIAITGFLRKMTP